MKTIKNLKQTEFLFNGEHFKPSGIKALDAKHRIALGARLVNDIFSRIKIDAFQIFVSDAGDILFKPVVSVPSNEAWIYSNPKIITQIRKGLTEAGKGESEKIKDIEGFVDKL